MFPIEEKTLAAKTTMASAPALLTSSLALPSSSSAAGSSPAPAPVLPAAAAAAEETLLQSAAGAEEENDTVVAAAASVPYTPVPGLPELPDTNALLPSVQADAVAAIAALNNAVTYNGSRRIPYSSKSGPIWRRGVTPPTASSQANTPASEQPKVLPIPTPEGVVVEEYEVLSEERVKWVNGKKVTERLWVPFTVGRPVGSTAKKGSSSSYPALFILHSTSGNRARSLQRVIKAAQRGYVALAPDMRYFGTRDVLWVRGGGSREREEGREKREKEKEEKTHCLLSFRASSFPAPLSRFFFPRFSPHQYQSTNQ